MLSIKTTLRPLTGVNTDELVRRVAQRVERYAKLIVAEFGRTTSTWAHKPTFTSTVTIEGSKVLLVISTDSEIYRWVSEGTKGPYPIAARNAPFLAIHANEPKTRPGSLDSGAGRHGPIVAKALVVQHPGIKARKFREQIYNRQIKQLNREVEDEIKKYLREQGFKI